MDNIQKAEKTLSEMVKIVDKLSLLQDGLVKLIIPFIKFDTYIAGDEGCSQKEYKETLGITQQTDGFCFVDYSSRNIPVGWVIQMIKHNGKILFTDLIEKSI